MFPKRGQQQNDAITGKVEKDQVSCGLQIFMRSSPDDTIDDARPAKPPRFVYHDCDSLVASEPNHQSSVHLSSKSALDDSSLLQGLESSTPPASWS